MEVVVWNMEIMSPTIMPIPSIGAETMRIVMSDSRIIVMMVISVILTPLYRKDRTSSYVSRFHPSTKTNNIILNGSEIMTGGSIIMPMAMRALATIMSMTMKGIK